MQIHCWRQAYLLITILSIFSIFDQLQAQSKEAIAKYDQAIKYFNEEKSAEGMSLLEEIIEANPDYEDARYAFSYYAMQEGKYQEALHEYHYLIRQNPKNHEIYLYRGQAYLMMEMFAEAEEDYLFAYQLDSTQIDITNALGSLYYWMELPEDANYYFGKSIQKNPKDALAYYYRALNYYENNQWEEAWADVTQYNALAADEPDGQRLKAMILIAQNKHNSAIAVFEALEKDENSIFEDEDFFYWGQAYYFLRKYEEAKFYFELPEEPQFPLIYYYLGKTYYHLNQSETALLNLNKAIEQWQDAKHGEISPVYYDRAVVNSRQKNDAQAELDFLKAIYLMPEIINQKDEKGNEIPLLSNALVMLKLDKQLQKIDSVLIKGYQARAGMMIADGDSNRAVAVCNAALKIDSLNSSTYTLRAGAYLLVKNYKSALQDLNQAEKLEKEQSLAQNYYFKALLYQSQSQPDSVIKFLEKAQEIDPQKVEIYFEKALFYASKDDFKQALSEINQALKIAIDDTQFLNERAGIYLKLKQYEEAIKDSDQILLLNPQEVRALYQRGLSHRALKHYQEALDDFSEILDMYPEELEIIDLALEMEGKLNP